jgi:hypothetical protein
MPMIRTRQNRQTMPLLASYQEAVMSPAVLGSALGAAAVTVGRGAATAVGNGLSFASELLRAAGAPATATEGQPSAAANDRTSLTQRIDELRERIRQQLAAAGICLSQPVELTGNGAGGIAVAADHPQRAAIEKALGSDFLLEHDFNQLAGDYNDFIAQHGPGDLPPTMSIRVSSQAKLIGD